MELNEQKSLQLIEDMIKKAKDQYSDNGFLYLLWGWLVLLASLSHYFLLQSEADKPYLAWLLMPLGGVISAVYAMQAQKKSYHKTYTDDVMKYTWMAFLFTLGIVLFSMNKLQEYTYPMVILLYGIPTFISGGVLKFKPLIIGGSLCWILSILSMFQPFEYQLLLLAASVLSAYIIPGHLLRNQYLKKSHQNAKTV